MRFVKIITVCVRSVVSWIVDLFRTVWTGESYLRRFIALVAILSLLMVVAFAALVVLDRRPTHLVIATATPGGEYHGFGKALEKLTSNHRLKIRITARPTQGSQENMALLEKGEVALAIVENDTPALPAVRAIAGLFPEMLHFIAAEDANISGIPDLRGKRVAVMPNLLGGPHDTPGLFYRLAKRYGLEKGDFASVVPLDLDHQVSAFQHRKVDAALLFIALGNRCVADLLRQSARPARLVPIEVHALETWHPYVAEGRIYRAAYHGFPPVPAANVPTVSVQALLLTHKNVGKEPVHAVTQILFEYRNELLRQNAHASTISFPGSGEDMGIPIHPGAQAHYDQKLPSFLVSYAEVFGLALAIASLLASGILQLRVRFREGQRKRADMYNFEMLNLVEDVPDVKKLSQLHDIRQKLADIFRRVLNDLEHDRISPELFQIFAHSCEIAIGALRHREMILLHLAKKVLTADEETESAKKG